MLRSRVTLAVIGMLIIGGLGAMGAIVSTPRPKSVLAGSGQSQPTATAKTTTALPSPTATTPQQTDDPQPTASLPSPTSTPRGQVSLRGSVIGSSINASAQTFQITQRTGSPVTIEVDGSTQFQGVAQRFGDLTGGLLATITGTFQSNGDFLAMVISTSPPDN